jgi:hypothetical protein
VFIYKELQVYLKRTFKQGFITCSSADAAGVNSARSLHILMLYLTDLLRVRSTYILPCDLLLFVLPRFDLKCTGIHSHVPMQTHQLLAPSHTFSNNRHRCVQHCCACRSFQCSGNALVLAVNTANQANCYHCQEPIV